MSPKLSPLEIDLLDHMVSGRLTHRSDGTEMGYGAWVTACSEGLYAAGMIGRGMAGGSIVYAPTPAGKSFIEQLNAPPPKEA